jgi:hypothetical protein
VAHLRLLAKLFCESKANRDAASRTDTCRAVIKLLLSNVEKIQIAANVTLSCLTHEHEVNAAAVQSLQGIPYILDIICRPNASTRLKSATLWALNSLSQAKLCRSEIIEYHGGDGIRGIVEATPCGIRRIIATYKNKAAGCLANCQIVPRRNE